MWRDAEGWRARRPLRTTRRPWNAPRRPSTSVELWRCSALTGCTSPPAHSAYTLAAPRPGRARQCMWSDGQWWVDAVVTTTTSTVLCTWPNLLSTSLAGMNNSSPVRCPSIRRDCAVPINSWWSLTTVSSWTTAMQHHRRRCHNDARPRLGWIKVDVLEDCLRLKRTKIMALASKIWPWPWKCWSQSHPCRLYTLLTSTNWQEARGGRSWEAASWRLNVPQCVHYTYGMWTRSRSHPPISCSLIVKRLQLQLHTAIIGSKWLEDVLSTARSHHQHQSPRVHLWTQNLSHSLSLMNA